MPYSKRYRRNFRGAFKNIRAGASMAAGLLQQAYSNYKNRRNQPVLKLRGKSQPKTARDGKVPNRFPSSFTKTNTKKRKRRGHQGVINTIWDAATEHWKKVFRRPMFRRKLGQATVYESWQTVAQGANGIQNVLTLKSIMPTSAIQSGETSTNRSAKDTMNTDIWLLHPSVTNTGGGYAGSTVNPRENAIYWRTTDLKLEVTSLEAATQEVTIIWTMPRTAVENDPIATWASALSSQGWGIAPAADPTVVQTTYTVGSGVTSTYGYDPRAIPAWKKAYRVIKVHKFLMPPGETHKINCNFHINKYISKTWADEMVDEESFYVPHLTIIPVMIVRGLPVVGSTTSGDPPVATTAMMHATTKVGVMMTFKHFLNFCDHNKWNFQRVNLGAPVNQSGGTFTEQLINDEEDPHQNIGVPTVPPP